MANKLRDRSWRLRGGRRIGVATRPLGHVDMGALLRPQAVTRQALSAWLPWSGHKRKGGPAPPASFSFEALGSPHPPPATAGSIGRDGPQRHGVPQQGAHG
eukprot:707036-Prymnesium_polylepis.2